MLPPMVPVSCAPTVWFQLQLRLQQFCNCHSSPTAFPTMVNWFYEAVSQFGETGMGTGEGGSPVETIFRLVPE